MLNIDIFCSRGFTERIEGELTGSWLAAPPIDRHSLCMCVGVCDIFSHIIGIENVPIALWECLCVYMYPISWPLFTPRKMQCLWYLSNQYSSHRHTCKHTYTLRHRMRPELSLHPIAITSWMQTGELKHTTWAQTHHGRAAVSERVQTSPIQRCWLSCQLICLCSL